MGKEINIKKIERFKAAKLYAITCELAPGQSYDAMAEAACRGGVDVLQFREKRLPAGQRLMIASRMSVICRRYRVLFIVNDSLDIALASGADGVHLGQEDLPIAAARELVGRSGATDFLIGESTHSVSQAQKAERDGADYIGIGPVYATPTKPSYNAVGLELVRQVTMSVKTPHVAIGGIDAINVRSVLDAGAERVAVVRAVCGAEDIAAAAEAMKNLIAERAPTNV